MPASETDRYNLVILPLNDHRGSATLYQFSANCPGVKRMISPAWSESRSREALRTAGVTSSEIEELFRGNNRLSGGGDARKLFFREQQLLDMGLQEAIPAMQTP